MCRALIPTLCSPSWARRWLATRCGMSSKPFAIRLRCSATGLQTAPPSSTLARLSCAIFPASRGPRFCHAVICRLLLLSPSRAQELALRQLLQDRALDRARAEGELERAQEEQRRLDGDCRRLLDLSNTLRAKLAVRVFSRSLFYTNIVSDPTTVPRPLPTSPGRDSSPFHAFPSFATMVQHAEEEKERLQQRLQDAPLPLQPPPQELPPATVEHAHRDAVPDPSQPLSPSRPARASQKEARVASEKSAQHGATAAASTAAAPPLSRFEERADRRLQQPGHASSRTAGAAPDGRASPLQRRSRVSPAPPTVSINEDVDGATAARNGGDSDDGRPGTGLSLLSSLSGLDESLAAVWRLVDGQPNQSADLALAETPLPHDESGEKIGGASCGERGVVFGVRASLHVLRFLPSQAMATLA